MGDVQVAGVDHRLLRVQCFQVGEQVGLPLHPVVNALELLLGVGGVAADEEKALKFQRDESSLVVVRVDTHAVTHRQRLLAGEHRRAGIALLVRAVPELFVAGQLQFELAGLQFGLL